MLLTVLAVALFAGTVVEAKKKSFTIQHVRVVGEKGEVFYDFLPYSEVLRTTPILKEAVKSNPKYEPKCVLRLLALIYPSRDLPLVIRGLKRHDHVTNIPKLKQWYRATFLDKDGRIYGIVFGETKEGKGWMDPHGKFNRLNIKTRMEKTKKLLKKRDFKGLYKYWMPPGTVP